MYVGVFARNFGNIGNAYDEYGFAYCFSNSLFNSGIDKPKEYNENTIRDILARMDELESERDEYRSERNDLLEEERASRLRNRRAEPKKIRTCRMKLSL